MGNFIDNEEINKILISYFDLYFFIKKINLLFNDNQHFKPQNVICDIEKDLNNLILNYESSLIKNLFLKNSLNDLSILKDLITKNMEQPYTLKNIDKIKKIIEKFNNSFLKKYKKGKIGIDEQIKYMIIKFERIK